MYKSFITCIFLLPAFIYAGDTFIVVDKDVKVSSSDGKSTLYVGSPLTVTNQEGETSKIVLKGYLDTERPNTLFADNAKKIIVAQSDSIKKEGDKGTLETSVATKNITTNKKQVWKYSETMFFEKCTQCHAAPEIDSHSMLEWEGLVASMEQFAQPTPKERETILHFLKSNAKDSVLK